jgi:ABC-2 type transport system ATP-binding protein
MIKISNLDKKFDDFSALIDLDLHVKKGSIYGLVGTNGAGKTTVIKHVTGILKPDSGEVLIEGSSVYENISLKQRMGFIPDDLYFFASYNLKESAKFYKSIYPNWSKSSFSKHWWTKLMNSLLESLLRKEVWTY